MIFLNMPAIAKNTDRVNIDFGGILLSIKLADKQKGPPESIFMASRCLPGRMSVTKRNRFSQTRCGLAFFFCIISFAY